MTDSGPVEKPDQNIDKASQQGFFNISTMARERVADKRKRKGLGDLKKREKDVY